MRFTKNHPVAPARLTALTHLILIFAISAASPVLSADVLTEAKTLIDGRDAAAAYELLKAEEETRAGEPDFDFLLGQAAVECGKPLDAVFALERVLDAMPDHGPARAELARAYLALGETEDARKEFEKVRGMKLPSEVSQRIDQYLTGIKLYDDATRTRFRPYVLAAMGYDSNVNSATDNSRVAVPALGGLEFLLDNTSQELDSAIWDIGAGMSFSSPLDASAGLSLVGGIAIDHRVAMAESDFSGNSYGGDLGLLWRRGQHQFRVGAEANRFNIDGASSFNSDRQVGGGVAQWQYTLSQSDQLSLFGQYSMIRFPEQRVRNVNRITGGGAWAHAFSETLGQPVLVLSAFGGDEAAQNERLGAHFGRGFYGARAGVQWVVRDRDSAFASFTYQNSEYDQPDPVFLATREDDYYDFLAGYVYRHTRNWSLSPTLRYNTSDSNLVTSEFDRVEVMVTVRNDF